MGTALGLGIGIPFLRRIGGGGNTPRTAAFLAATGITDPTIISALNTLDNSLITAGLLPSGTGSGKIKALYPIVGGTATTHKFNFVDPRDLNPAFRLDFFGGLTHSSNGILPNGVNGYADTFVNALSNLNNDNLHMSFYSRTNNQTVGYEIGVLNTELNIICSYSSSNLGYLSYDGFSSFSVSDSQGLYILSKTPAKLEGYKKGVKVVNVSKSPKILPNLTIPLFADNRTTYFEFSSKECAFATIGEGLTESEAISLTTINNTFQTTLGRAV
jgi:hypothetical protein